MLTKTQYSYLQDAYDWFNAKLFERKLPEVFLSFQKQKPNIGGTYCARALISRKKDQGSIAEIELNPNSFKDKNDTELLSTLVHEMAHHWQHSSGNASRGYHDKAWGAKMEAIGLMPSNTGAPGGKRTGYQMTHYVLPGGKFEKASQEFLKKYKKIFFVEGGISSLLSKAGLASRMSKTKFSCPHCKQNAWAKPDTNIICGDCNQQMED